MRSTRSLATSVVWLLLSVVAVTITVVAQLAPNPVQEMGFVRAGSKLYIQGGKYDVNGTRQSISSQLFSLDLATSWPTTSPPWKSLAPGRSVYFINAVASPDNSSIYTIGTGNNNTFVFTKYDILLDQWMPSFQTAISTETRTGARAVIDPLSWRIYLDGTSFMNVYNLNTSDLITNPIPPNTFTSRLFSGAVFNQARGSVLYYGGLNFSIKLDPEATYVSEYNIREDGNKIVVYGGRVEAKMSENPPVDYTDTLYILDVPSGQWTQGPSGTPRLYMACVIVGDQFLAWGGSKGGGYTDTGPPVVFDLTKMQWVNSYTAPAYYLDPKPSQTAGAPTPTGGPLVPGARPDSPESKSSNLGAILGGVLGSLFVLVAAYLFYRFKLRDKTDVKYSTPVEQKNVKNDNEGGVITRNPHSLGTEMSRKGNPQELVGLNQERQGGNAMYNMHVAHRQPAEMAHMMQMSQPTAFVQQSVTASTTPTLYNGVSGPGFVHTNAVAPPMMYVPQTGYAGATVPGGGFIMDASLDKRPETAYHAHQYVRSQLSDGALFNNTSLATKDNNSNSINGYQLGYSHGDGGVVYITSSPPGVIPVSPTTTQQVYMAMPTQGPMQVPMQVPMRMSTYSSSLQPTSIPTAASNGGYQPSAVFSCQPLPPRSPPTAATPPSAAISVATLGSGSDSHPWTTEDSLADERAMDAQSRPEPAGGNSEGFFRTPPLSARPPPIPPRITPIQQAGLDVKRG
ncbi:hypothetical protein BGZ94_008549 [Podila epigama]|nr:hypothetical protein BGZ94_008549 [Podila epigama]